MAYNFSKGRQIIGDLSGSDDSGRDTGIDFEDDYIGLQTGGATNFVLSGSKVGIGISSPSYKLDVDGDIRIRGNDIRDNSGNKAISFDGSANTTVVNNLGVNGVTSPIAELDVAGKIAITAESSTPSQPSDGQGYLYTKSDGKIYWRSYDVSETDLTSGGGGGGSPGGSDTQVQINNGGSFGGLSGLTYDGDTLFVSSSLQLVGEEKINDPEYASGEQANRSFTLKRHYNFSLSANTATNVISWRPYLEGGTTEPSHFHGVVAFKMEILGHQNGVANGYRSRKGFVSYEGSSAANAHATDETFGSGPISTSVSRSGWVTTLVINADSANSQGFRGTVYVEVHFARGAGTNGEGIYWSIT